MHRSWPGHPFWTCASGVVPEKRTIPTLTRWLAVGEINGVKGSKSIYDFRETDGWYISTRTTVALRFLDWNSFWNVQWHHRSVVSISANRTAGRFWRDKSQLWQSNLDWWCWPVIEYPLRTISVESKNITTVIRKLRTMGLYVWVHYLRMIFVDLREEEITTKRVTYLFVQPWSLWALDGKGKNCQEFDTSDILATRKSLICSDLSTLGDEHIGWHIPVRPLILPAKRASTISRVIRLNKARLWSLESRI